MIASQPAADRVSNPFCTRFVRPGTIEYCFADGDDHLPTVDRDDLGAGEPARDNDLLELGGNLEPRSRAGDDRSVGVDHGQIRLPTELFDHQQVVVAHMMSIDDEDNVVMRQLGMVLGEQYVLTFHQDCSAILAP